MIQFTFAALCLMTCTSLFGAWSQSTTQTPQPMNKTNGELKNTPNGTVVEIIAAGRDYTTLAQALQATELANTLQNGGPYTLFIPSNTAFRNMPEGTLQKLFRSESKDRLKSLLLYHIVPGKMMPNDLKPGKYKTLNGGEITITNEKGQIKVNGINVMKNSAVGKNGVIYVLEEVLTPNP